MTHLQILKKDIDKDMLTSLLIQMSKMFLLKEQR